jgi:phosphatidylserine/phosphatidylglycerophosphate/cardiolipin synthase-like enzyme
MPVSAASTELRVPPAPGPPGFRVRKLHHKTAVVDDRTVIAGSFNDTRPGDDSNDENIFVVGSAYDEIKEPGRTIKVAADPLSGACYLRAAQEWRSRRHRSCHETAGTRKIFRDFTLSASRRRSSSVCLLARS